ncbi:hypothetical protein M440DRAFT_215378 [Trichoderma longibrachiatum ATCC 18648]|uniref:Uncharacterized protein n=1 Tax=Trichoderma longibrachiatum ATCC 18648 TaxID=983965 RepID=A0A2T4BQE3_TRILO|nr:hypothetical protein M440DRAFT_215378 [Trichoderma longibrachiatum ATCC 18648]
MCCSRILGCWWTGSGICSHIEDAFIVVWTLFTDIKKSCSIIQLHAYRKIPATASASHKTRSSRTAQSSFAAANREIKRKAHHLDTSNRKKHMDLFSPNISYKAPKQGGLQTAIESAPCSPTCVLRLASQGSLLLSPSPPPLSLLCRIPLQACASKYIHTDRAPSTSGCKNHALLCCREEGLRQTSDRRRRQSNQRRLMPKPAAV